MSGIQPSVAVSPRVGSLLMEVAETPDLEVALWKILTEYMALKMRVLREQIRSFESKWGMSFEEFSGSIGSDKIDRDRFSYEVESDFWEWEKAVTLLRYYEEIRQRWT